MKMTQEKEYTTWEGFFAYAIWHKPTGHVFEYGLSKDEALARALELNNAKQAHND